MDLKTKSYSKLCGNTSQPTIGEIQTTGVLVIEQKLVPATKVDEELAIS
jgi:hypothetical protein